MIHTLLLFVVSTGVLSACPTDDPAAVLNASKQWYARGEYDSASRCIRSFLEKNGTHPASRELVPLLVEILIRRNRHATAQRLCRIYVRKFPRSPFIPRIHYARGFMHAREGAYDKSLDAFSLALSAGLAPALDSAVFKNVKMLCEHSLTADTISYWAHQQALNPRLREYLGYRLLEKLYRNGRYGDAARRAKGFLKQYPRSGYADGIREMIDRHKGAGRDGVKIGVLVPLSGYHAEIGRQVLDGIQLAFDHVSANGAGAITPVIRDTRGDAVATAATVHRLVHEDEITVYLGPILSETAVIASAMLMDREAVMVSPTATDDGIARLGPGIFQINTPLSNLGRTIAEYALNNLNIREFAVVSPLSPYGEVLSRNFKETVRQSGGHIVAEEFFEEGAQDYRQQFESLRKKLFAHRREKIALERGLEYMDTLSDPEADSLFLADSVLAVGGLFMPATAEDVVMLAPQVYFHRIRAQLLGSTGWHSNTTLLDGKKYVENAVISTNFHINQRDPRWVEFSRAYRARFKQTPGRPASLGYDAAMLVLKTIADLGNAATARRIARGLLQTQNYHGASGMISLDSSHGENREAAILKVRNRKFIRIH